MLAAVVGAAVFVAAAAYAILLPRSLEKGTEQGAMGVPAAAVAHKGVVGGSVVPVVAFVAAGTSCLQGLGLNQNERKRGSKTKQGKPKRSKQKWRKGKKEICD